MDKVETIWDYLESKGFNVDPRKPNKTVQLVLESSKMNKSQKARMDKIPKYIVSEKLDGVYSIVTVVKGEIRHWGRSGKALANCESLIDIPSFATAVFISEITSSEPLAKLSGYLNPNRKNAPTFVPRDLKDNLHDCFTIEAFIKGKATISYQDRYTVLQAVSSCVIPAKKMTYEEAQAYAKSYIFPTGGEGVVGVDPQSPWVAGVRDETMFKIKEKLSFDVKVVDIVEGKKGSKYEGTTGALVVHFRAFGSPEGNPMLIPISGMTDAQRTLWWDDRDLIIGKCVKMDAKSYTETGNLREPRFKEIREDKEADLC